MASNKDFSKIWKAALEDDRDEWDFGLPDREELWVNASFEWWARAPFWSADECAALKLGKDPGQISGLDIDQLVRTARFGSTLEHIREEILEAQANKELPERIRPVEFLAWAREHDIRVPAKLEQAVADNGYDVAALQNQCQRLRRQNQKLLYELDRLRGGVPASKKDVSKKKGDLSSKERSSLLKMVIAMAVTKYGYDPKASRNPAAKDIADEIHARGMRLDEDTCRKRLREAADEEWPPQQA